MVIIWILLMKGELYLAPVHRPKRILDLGTGTGIWAIDIAELETSPWVIPIYQLIASEESFPKPRWSGRI